MELRERLVRHARLVGAAVGSGMTAAAAEEGEADFVVVLSAGHFRTQGVGSAAALMPYGNANEVTWQLARQHVIPRLRRTPVFLGVCAHDPSLSLEMYLDRASEAGVVGVTNYPTVGLYGDGRQVLEEDGITFAQEQEMLARAHAKGLLTLGFCLTADDAAAMARAGTDILCLNLGTAEWRTLEGDAHQAALDRAVATLSRMIAAAKAVRADAYCVASGGPLVMPQDAAFIFQRTQALGYLGGSSIERVPTAPTVTQTVREFKQVTAAVGKEETRLGAMIGVGPAMQDVFESVRAVAASDAPVLIIGESGTGKELAAREIHRLSHLHAQPLVSWNCGAMTESLAMSELFGHEKGAFTGATRTHIGKFELATGGTLFMDEVTDLPPSVQAALLRVLQQKEIVRVGGERTMLVDVRVVAASNKEFRDLIPTGRFRLDLYYRLSTIVIRMPPLRERPEDIPHLIRDVARELAQRYGRAMPRLTDPVMNVLVRHNWPGNIRELRNAVERMFVFKAGGTPSRAWLEEMLAGDRALGERLVPPSSPHLSLTAKRERLEEVLSRNGGSKTAAARELGVTRKTIHKWLRS